MNKNISGKTPVFKDKHDKLIKNSIAKMEVVTLGGYNQTIIIRGRDKTKPVLLFLHGGPGGTEAPVFQKAYPQLEDEFVVVHWEQRGAGKSYSKHIPVDSMTLEQFTKDAHELTQYLKEKFDQEKIYLMGHSWGTMLGMNTIYHYPENYIAYFGVGQISDQKKSEKESYHWVISEAEKRGHKKAVRKLKAIGEPQFKTNKEWVKYLLTIRSYSIKYGGTFRKFSVWNFIITMLLAKEYTLPEKLNIYRGLKFSLNLIVMEFLEFNMVKEIKKVEIPTYFFHGVYDYDTTLNQAKKYIEMLEAPKKELFVFKHSAHQPFWAEAELFHKKLMGIVKSEEISLKGLTCEE